MILVGTIQISKYFLHMPRLPRNRSILSRHYLIYVITKISQGFENLGTHEGRHRTDQSISSRDYVHHVVPNELWISWKEFGPLAYCWQDTAFLRYFLRDCRDPHQEYQKNLFSNFDLKFCTKTDLNESGLLWKFQLFRVLLVWNKNIRICLCKRCENILLP